MFRISRDSVLPVDNIDADYYVDNRTLEVLSNSDARASVLDELDSSVIIVAVRMIIDGKSYEPVIGINSEFNVVLGGGYHSQI